MVPPFICNPAKSRTGPRMARMPRRIRIPTSIPADPSIKMAPPFIPVRLPRYADPIWPPALPAITGKIELEYEGELKGAHAVAKELIRNAVAQVFDGYFVDADVTATVNWFENGGSVMLGDGLPASALVVEASKVPGLMDLASRAALPPGAPAPLVAAAVDFVLEGLAAQKRIGRTEAGGYVGTEPLRKPQTTRQAPAISLDEDDEPGGPPKKKRYYN